MLKANSASPSRNNLTKNDLSKISFDIFFNFLITALMHMVINMNVNSYYIFWNYVYSRIIEYGYTEIKPINVKEVKLRFIKLFRHEKLFYSLFVSEDINDLE